MLPRLILFAALATAAAPALADSACYTGYAYHPDSGELAFTARYRPTDGQRPSDEWRVVYRAPDGEVIARKRLSFAHDPFVPVLTKRFLQSGTMVGIRRSESGDWRMVERQGPDGELTVEPFELTENTAADTGIHRFIQAHFDRLMAGEAVSFRFVLVPRRRVVDMQAERISDTRIDGQPAVRFRASVDMLFVSWFADELVFTYDPNSKQLLRYRGISTMQNRDGDPYPVRIRYRRDRPPSGVSACG